MVRRNVAKFRQRMRKRRRAATEPMLLGYINGSVFLKPSIMPYESVQGNAHIFSIGYDMSKQPFISRKEALKTPLLPFGMGQV